MLGNRTLSFAVISPNISKHFPGNSQKVGKTPESSVNKQGLLSKKTPSRIDPKCRSHQDREIRHAHGHSTHHRFTHSSTNRFAKQPSLAIALAEFMQYVRSHTSEELPENASCPLPLLLGSILLSDPGSKCCRCELAIFLRALERRTSTYCYPAMRAPFSALTRTGVPKSASPSLLQ